MNPLKILIVEDNVDGAETLAAVLRMIGSDVQIAHDGLAGLDLSEKYKPDVVLLDIGLPVVDGFQVAKSLRCFVFAVVPLASQMKSALCYKMQRRFLWGRWVESRREPVRQLHPLRRSARHSFTGPDFYAHTPIPSHDSRVASSHARMLSIVTYASLTLLWCGDPSVFVASSWHNRLQENRIKPISLPKEKTTAVAFASRNGMSYG